MTTITLVEKIKADGTPCRKCHEVRERLERDGVVAQIDHIVTADEREPASEGMRIAARHGIERAPFFVVEEPGEPVQVYTVYMRLLRDVLRREGNDHDQATNIVDSGAIDFL